MWMILFVIILAAGMLWFGISGSVKEKHYEEGGNPLFHVIVASFGGIICIILVAGIGGEAWAFILGTVVFFGTLYYFLADTVNRSRRITEARIAQLERKIDELTALLEKD